MFLFTVFASVPSMEKQLLGSKILTQIIILDLTGAHRIETTTTHCLMRCVHELELKNNTLVICGMAKNSGLQAGFARAEVPLAFDTEEKAGEKEIQVFATWAACMAWCQHQRTESMLLDNKPLARLLHNWIA
ncbi:hypothetical protein B0H17DRAFT_1205866 [Mycena rosella]|uniref:STAS domain-containing protein n=1 Tax=Mycena rosella TaxID=1033263 RepID=A0AAD7GC65_MYCRO|nr:hypothetical protein B0H17DRAFT_1205866 [Mycena rosella]